MPGAVTVVNDCREDGILDTMLVALGLVPYCGGCAAKLESADMACAAELLCGTKLKSGAL